MTSAAIPSVPRPPGPSLGLSIVLIVVGAALAIPTMIVGIVAIAGSAGHTFSPPGPVRMHLSSGTYEVYENTGTVSIGSSFSPNDVTITPGDVTVTGATGTVEVFDQGAVRETRSSDGEEFVGAARFTTPAAGDYVITVRNTQRLVMVARPFSATVRSALGWFALALLGGLIGAAGIVLLIVGAVRRSKARNTFAYAYAPVPAAPARPAPNPPGWHPDPSGSGRWRYWDGSRWTEHLQ